MQDLPYDIWLLITEYLSEKQVRRMYSVNKALFNIAMDLRYKEVTLGFSDTRRTLRSDIRYFQYVLFT